MIPLLGRRVVARIVDGVLAIALYQLISLYLKLPVGPLFSLVAYQLCSMALGQSLGRNLFRLKIQAPSRLRLVFRELIFWALAPFILLSALGSELLHDKITSCSVGYDR